MVNCEVATSLIIIAPVKQALQGDCSNLLSALYYSHYEFESILLLPTKLGTVLFAPIGYTVNTHVPKVFLKP